MVHGKYFQLLDMANHWRPVFLSEKKDLLKFHLRKADCSFQRTGHNLLDIVNRLCHHLLKKKKRLTLLLSVFVDLNIMPMPNT